MAARTFERHPFACQTTDRKVGELRVSLSLNHHRCPASLGGLDAKQHGGSSCTARAVDDHIHAAPVRELEEACERVLLLYIDDRVGAHRCRDLQPASIA